MFPTTKTGKAAAAAASSCKSELCKQAQRCSFISSSFSLKATAKLLAFTHVIITRQLLPKSINQLIRTYREHSFFLSFFSILSSFFLTTLRTTPKKLFDPSRQCFSLVKQQLSVDQLITQAT